MKKTLVLMLIIFSCAVTQAATTRSVHRDTGTYAVIEIPWEADATGAVQSFQIDKICGFVLQVTTVPGTPAPTDLYDVSLRDADTVDIMGNALADRSATVAEQAVPYIGATYSPRYVCSQLTVSILNNAVVGAQGTVVLYVAR